MNGALPAPFSAAVVQAAAVPFDRERSLQKLADLAHQVAAAGAELAVFPEAFVSGYPSSLDWGGASAAIRHAAAADDYRRYWHGAIELPDGGAPAIARIARATKLTLVVGVVERALGSLYCSVVVHGPDGRLLGKRRKLTPSVAERLVWAQGDGAALDVLATPLGRLGAAICWENYLPLLRMHYYRQGVQLYCAPTADDEDTWAVSMRHIALEGRCYVLSANQFTRRGDFPADYGNFPDDDPGFVVSRGGSCIVDPFGRLLAGPDHAGETILYAHVDLNEVVRGKFFVDVAGHYSRPDVFSFDLRRPCGSNRRNDRQRR